MEFWGVEVKTGQKLPVYPGDTMVVHLSQANIGELTKEKGSESICLYVTVGGKKLVLSTLHTEKLPQQQFDLIFDSKFELSHNWKNGSVYFYGYKADKHGLETDDELDSDDVEALIAQPQDQPKTETPAVPEKERAGKESAAVQEKENAAKESAGKKKVKIYEPKNGQEEDEDDESSDEDEDMDADDDDSDLELDSDEDESDSEDEESEDEETPKKVQSGKKKPAESKKVDEESEDEEAPKKVQSGKKKPAASKNKSAVPAKKDEDESDSEDDESEEEETPKKAQSGKKRAAESSKKTPAKKVKLSTPQKTDGKKSNDHVATPHPSKKSGKTTGKQTPKSAGSHKCQKCDRTFVTEAGLGSHTKDKHGAAK